MSDEDDDLAARRDRLAAALKARQPKPAPETSANASSASASAAWSMAAKAGSEFVVSVLLGGAIGYGLDRLLHTKPALTIVFFLFGVVAGVYSLIRSTSSKSGAQRP